MYYNTTPFLPPQPLFPKKLPYFIANGFVFPPIGINKGQSYIFPRVAKNNRAVLPNCARGVSSYRKTFLEVYVLFN